MAGFRGIGVWILVGLAMLFVQAPAFAHGVNLEESRGDAVRVVAAFDNGDVMDEAQVTVYSPEDPSEPWATGTTDGDGRYVFMPDESQPGSWSVQVRKAGHGATTAVEVAEGGGAEGGDVEEVGGNSGGASQMQMGLMGALGLWGFVGTALYFKSRRV